jgi:hypothetical protein
LLEEITCYSVTIFFSNKKKKNKALVDLAVIIEQLNVSQYDCMMV